MSWFVCHEKHLIFAMSVVLYSTCQVFHNYSKFSLEFRVILLRKLTDYAARKKNIQCMLCNIVHSSYTQPDYAKLVNLPMPPNVRLRWEPIQQNVLWLCALLEYLTIPPCCHVIICILHVLQISIWRFYESSRRSVVPSCPTTLYVSLMMERHAAIPYRSIRIGNDERHAVIIYIL